MTQDGEFRLRRRAAPTQEPPDGVTAELLWRAAQRLYSDHAAAECEACVACRQPWPCSGRRLAELALIAAVP